MNNTDEMTIPSLRENAKKWRLILDGPHTGFENMAIDEALLQSHARGESPPILRLYQWSPAALTIGYFQAYEREVDPHGCRERGFDWVRRPTGGRAVLHQHELTYAVIISEELLKGSVLQTYLALSTALVSGLDCLGIESQLAPGRPPTRKTRDLSSAACFDSATPHEVTVQGKKVIGSAQVRQEGTILQHGSVPLYLDRDAVVDCLQLGSEAVTQRVRKTLDQKAAGLAEVTDRDLDYNSVGDALRRGFENVFDLTFERGELWENEKQDARQLCDEKYSTDEWNKKR